ncbi:MAG: hypothetical protein GY852_10215 [bacterium]|nr:hypothetical protein [bacterium]
MKKRGKTEKGFNPLFVLPLFLLLAIATTWPLALSPEPFDDADTLFNCWLLEWNNHALLTGQNPTNLPIFEGFQDGDGRNDLLLTQSLLALPMKAFGMDAVRMHNILLVLFLAFAGFTASILASETGASRYGSVFTGSVVILLPYFQSHMWHLQLFSVGLSFLAIVFALRILKGKTPGWQLAVLIFLQCLASLYHWYFLNLALLLLTASVLFLPERNKLPRMICWWTAGNLAALPFLLPHLKNAQVWSVDTITSTDFAAFLAPWENSMLLGWMRMENIHPEAALWPGIAVIAGAIWFLAKGKRKKWDTFLLTSFLFFSVFSLGPTLVAFGKELSAAPFRLIAELPGCSSIRLPARAAIFALVPLAIFAGRKFEKKPILVLAAIILTAATAWHAPLRTVQITPQPWHLWLAEQNFSSVLYLPVSTDMDRPQTETRRLFGSIGHFTPSLNGYSTTLPKDYENYALILNNWPENNAILLIEELGIDCIIVKGWQTHEADTVFFTDGMSVSAVVTNLN